MISEEKKFIFIHIPKTAGNSIQYALKKYSSDKFRFKNDGINKFELVNKFLNDNSKHTKIFEYQNYYNLENYYKITSVRNPWDRCLSFYFFNNVNKKINFYNYLKKCKNYLEHIKNKKGEIKIDKFVYYETLKNDFSELCVYLNIDNNNLLHLNKSKNNKINYRDYYDDKSKDIVYKIYKEDIKLFGYEF